MSLAPLLSSSLAIQLHVYTVIPAALIGGWMLVARKGTPLHRIAGRVWIGLMVVTALSSFFIHQLDLLYGFSPIHVLSIVTLFGCYHAVRLARAGHIAKHQRVVKSLYFGGIGIAGLFTLLPGRIMNRMIFGEGGVAMAWLRPDEAKPFWLFATVAIAVTILMTGRYLARRRQFR